MFYVTISEISKVFNTLTLKQISWKIFKKLEYRFLVETTENENTSKNGSVKNQCQDK